LPFEFLVKGNALSQQASGPSKEAWKAEMRRAAQAPPPEGYWLLTAPLAVTIFIFPNGKFQGDIDNRVKPIFDAMSKCVYRDDELVERLVVQKFELEHNPLLKDPSTRLATALAADEPLAYIRIGRDPREGLCRRRRLAPPF